MIEREMQLLNGAWIWVKEQIIFETTTSNVAPERTPKAHQLASVVSQ